MRTFCCIIPARLGVLVLAPLTGAAATICCFFALYALIHFFDDLVLGQKVFLGLLGSSMAIVGLASIFGFLGAIIASLKAVSFYSAVLTTIWLSALLTGIINFVFLWKDRNYFVKSCAATNKDQIVGDVNDWCNGVSIVAERKREANTNIALYSLEIPIRIRLHGGLLGCSIAIITLSDLHRPPLWQATIRATLQSS